MIGGEKEVVEALNPCWQAMGKTFVHQGPPGAGQHAKLINQILVAAEHDRRVRKPALRLQSRAGPG